MQRGVIITVVVIALVIVLGAGYMLLGRNGNTEQNQDNPGSQSEGMNIIIENFAFSPSTLNVKIGDTVTWTNNDGTGHTVTSDSGSELDSPTLANGQSYSHTFNEAGTYNYHCTPHPGMKAKIVVS